MAGPRLLVRFCPPELTYLCDHLCDQGKITRGAEEVVVVESAGVEVLGDLCRNLISRLGHQVAGWRVRGNAA